MTAGCLGLRCTEQSTVTGIIDEGSFLGDRTNVFRLHWKKVVFVQNIQTLV